MENKNTEILVKSKTDGFTGPNMWLKLMKLTAECKLVSLGQGFPDWQPPHFFLEGIQKHFTDTAYYQYTRTMGNVKLCETIAKQYGPQFNREINPLTEVIVGPGALNLLYSAITGLVEPGQEVCIIEPFYDIYCAQIKMTGAKMVGVPLTPPKTMRNKSEYQNPENLKNIDDVWTLDMDLLRKSINVNTRVLVVNTPNNPTGKIMTWEELKEIAKIVEDFPKLTVVMDEVYEHQTFDKFETLPRFASLPGMFDRSINVYSAGKCFSATGMRIGWAVGGAKVIQSFLPVYQNSSFCVNDPIQLTFNHCLEEAVKPYKGFETFYKWLRNEYQELRNYLVSNLAKIDKLNFNFYLPDGGFFLMVDIGTEINEAKYALEFDDPKVKPYSNDFNYILNLAHKAKVLCVPVSPFYTPEHKQIGERFVRFAFCKTKKHMDAAFENFNKNF